jgi:cellulose synthase/poly-beta-1,6-N-acetylglucosamine synthase-like glycosyltransferase
MNILKTLNYIIDISLIGYSLYFLLFFFLGLFTRKNRDFNAPENRFAIIVPAHNEERVISKLLANLRELDYPQALYDIFVVADNCQDNTAKIAQSCHVNVFERISHTQKGKGYALKFALERIGFMEGDSNYDAAVVFDADNLVQENFLQVMNNRLLKGEKIIQAYVDAKNPADNWVTATFSMMFWINDRFNLLSRYNIGLSAVLMGTGMCISGDTLKKIGWDTVTLTEDLEYSIQALSQGIKTAFARETRIFDEKPLSFKASCRQRLRWGRGQLSVAFKYVPELLYQGFKQKRLAIIDGGFRLFQQPFIMFYSVMTVLRLTFPATFYSPFFNILLENVKILGFILPFVPFLLPSSVFLLDKLSFKSFKYVIFFPIFMYSWVLILYWALFTLNEKSWLPTTHSRNLSRERVLKEAKA